MLILSVANRGLQWRWHLCEIQRKIVVMLLGYLFTVAIVFQQENREIRHVYVLEEGEGLLSVDKVNNSS